MFSKNVREMVLAGMPPVWLYKHTRRQYVEAKIRATPTWVDRRVMFELKLARDERTRATGIKYTLDHIVPISHPMVCGLNVPWNLQIIPASVNAAKSNKWSPDQMELLPC